MTDKTSKLVSALYKTKFGLDLKKVTSTSGQQPSESNSFLFNPVMLQFHGLAVDNNGGKYLFFLMKDGDRWVLNSNKVG